jgi:hypothetical protein
MMAANYRHIGDLENRLGRHYSRFSASWPAAPLAAQSLARRKSPNHGSNRRSAALLAQPHPKAAVLRVDIFDCHAECRADTGEGIDHRPIRARSRSPACVETSMLSSNARASAGSSTGVCPDVTTCRGPRHRRRRVDWHHLAGDEPVEQVTARRRELARPGLNPRRNVHRLDGADRRHASARAPRQEFIGSAGIGPTRVRVADIGREEFEEAHRGALAGGHDQNRKIMIARRLHSRKINPHCLPFPSGLRYDPYRAAGHDQI